MTFLPREQLATQVTVSAWLEGRFVRHEITRSDEQLAVDRQGSQSASCVPSSSLGRGEASNSTLAISDGEIFLRTFRNLYCIAEK